MSRQYITDSANRNIAYTEYRNGRTHMYTAGNKNLGFFEESTGKTFTASNKEVGKGNLLGTLLK